MYSLFKPYQYTVIKYNFCSQCHKNAAQNKQKNVLYKQLQKII